MADKSRVTYAIAYARCGARVFPCHWISPDGQCSCGTADCRDNPKRRGKHPLHAGWQNEATCDEAVIKQLWAADPLANIGVACGKGSNLTVPDVDGAVGLDQLHDLEQKHGALPDAPRIITGSRGNHLMFEYQEGLSNSVRWAPGLDLRTEGGYVIGHGSSNAFGRYEFEVGHSLKDLPRAKMPDWLIDVIRNGQGGSTNGTNGNGTRFKVPEEPIHEGEGRNNFLFRAGRSMKAQHFGADAIEAALEATNRKQCRPPIGADEFKSILKSVLTQPDSADFKGAQSAEDDSDAASVQAEPIKALNARELLELEVAPRDYILEPVLRTRETGMIWAWRGTGKTYASMAIAYAIASGGQILKWKAPKPRRVVYIDGEMPVETLKERLASIVNGANEEPPDDDYLRIVTADLQDLSLPNLATPEGQAAFEPHIKDAEVIFLDSISTLCWGGRGENDSDSWLPLQQWALRLRREGKTVIFIHHAGKGGTQRGTSRREDVLDISIHLSQPSDYQPDQGARFEVHFLKTRGILGDAAKPFEATLIVRDGKAEWQVKDLADVMLQRAAELFNDGVTVRDVAEELKISKSSAQRLRNRAEAAGLLGRGTTGGTANGRWNES
jgi:bifunctional DNA primase/polymerase-like protein/AAA domain-containing protein/primase-like protein